jgi:hypothetical protein
VRQPGGVTEQRDPRTYLTGPADPDGRAFLTLDEAADLFRVSPRTARRWAAEYERSGGAYGIPVIRVSKRRLLVVVSLLLQIPPRSADMSAPLDEARPTPGDEPHANDAATRP